MHCDDNIALAGAVTRESSSIGRVLRLRGPRRAVNGESLSKKAALAHEES